MSPPRPRKPSLGDYVQGPLVHRQKTMVPKLCIHPREKVGWQKVTFPPAHFGDAIPFIGVGRVV